MSIAGAFCMIVESLNLLHEEEGEGELLSSISTAICVKSRECGLVDSIVLLIIS